MVKTWDKKYVPILSNFYIFLKNSPKNVNGSLDELSKSVLYRTLL